MKQLKIVLPVELRAELDAETAKSGKSLADEIRTRVEWTLDLAPVDKPTERLLKVVALMAAYLERECGAPWHAHAGTHAAFRTGVLSYLLGLKPDGTVAFGERPHCAVPGDDPEVIGVSIQEWIRDTLDWTREQREDSRLYREKNLRELLEFNRNYKAEGQQ
jgi:hypothetical protein